MKKVLLFIEIVAVGIVDWPTWALKGNSGPFPLGNLMWKWISSPLTVPLAIPFLILGSLGRFFLRIPRRSPWIPGFNDYLLFASKEAREEWLREPL